MPPSTWIRFPRFFSDVMLPRGPLDLWLQHADCSAPATGAEIEAVPAGKIFMTHGWGEIARVCRARGALAIHLEYDGVSTLLFKVFDARAAAWSAAPKRSVRLTRAPLTATPAAAAPGSPAALLSFTRLWR